MREQNAEQAEARAAYSMHGCTSWPSRDSPSRTCSSRRRGSAEAGRTVSVMHGHGVTYLRRAVEHAKHGQMGVDESLQLVAAIRCVAEAAAPQDNVHRRVLFADLFHELGKLKPALGDPSA